MECDKIKLRYQSKAEWTATFTSGIYFDLIYNLTQNRKRLL